MCAIQFSIPSLYRLPSVFESAHFDTLRRSESQLRWLKHLYEEHDAKSFTEGKEFIIPLPHSLHSLYSIPSAEVLPSQRNRKYNRFEEKNRRQLLKSSRSCWDAFSPPQENPAPQMRPNAGSFPPNFKITASSQKDKMLSPPAAQVPQTNTSFTWTLPDELDQVT